MNNIRDSIQRLIGFVLLRRNWIRLFVCTAIMLAIVYASFILIMPFDHDEVEHAHAAYKILQGKLPYRDFYQNHMPAYWLVGMQWIRLFPFSINAILAGRAVNLLAFAACWLLGFRLLRSIRGGRTWLGLALYSIAMISLAGELQIHEARPDPLMTLTATAAVFLIPLYGNISIGRALILGILFGLSLAFSTKAILIAMVVPGLIALHCIRDRRLARAWALLPYAAGIILSLLPTALWIGQNGLFNPFCFDVFGLNSALKKALHTVTSFLLIPIYLGSILGAIALLGKYKQRIHRLANTPMTLALTAVAGLALAVLARHGSRYNLQIVMVPMAVGFVSFVLYLCLRLPSAGSQLLLCLALIGYPLIYTKEVLVNKKNNAVAIPQQDLQELMNLARPGDRSCLAFSPSHPVFCRDISGLSNGWDLFFAENIRDPKQLARFHRLWRDGIQRAITQKPDLILRKSPDEWWERAVAAGLITPEDLQKLDSIRPGYDVRRIGSREVWVRRSSLQIRTAWQTTHAFLPENQKGAAR